jgi:lipopolysaccharide/colanic/teichoic acid biosynthesis glycosyltransferase
MCLNRIYARLFKGLIDKIVSFFALVVLSPILLILSILIRVNLGSPIIFKQDRVGYQDNIFTMYKFRTMADLYDENGKLLSDEKRLTKLGKFLRSTSLDELPELWNILKGDMSLVGPRPLLVRYLERYSEFQRRRHEVYPGLTGLAQVNGRNLIGWDEKFELDVSYVDRVSLRLDLEILFKTVLKVVGKEGITPSNSGSMSEFMGNDENKNK